MLSLLNREVNGLHQAAFLLAMASVGAKVLAVFRDRLLAGSFGAGKTLDIYYASFRLPDLLYVFSLFIVSITALIPLFLEKNTTLEKGRYFINGFFTIFFVLMTALVVVIFFLTPYITSIIAPGFSAEDTALLIQFSRILLLSSFLLGLSNLVSCVIQSFRRFFVYALSGVFYNAGIIFGLLFLYPRFGLSGIIWGVVVGALFHFLIQVPSLVHLGYFPKFSFAFHGLELKRLLRLSLPRTLGLTLNQLVLMAITAMASFLAAGSISVFNLASNLQTIPLGIVALSYSVAAFPSLASSFLKNDKEKFLSSVVSSFRHIVFWLLPASVLFIVLRAQIVRVLLGTGAFTWTDTRLTAASFAILTLSLFAQGLILLLVRAFYATGKTKIPLFINVVSSVVTIFFAFGLVLFFKYVGGVQAIFAKFLRVEGVAGISVLSLSLAYSLGTIFNFFVLFSFFKKEFASITIYIKKSIWQIVLVSLIMGAVAYITLAFFDNIFSLATFTGVFMQGFLSGLVALVIGFFLFKFFKNQEFEELVVSFRHKFSKKLVVKPEPEELP